MTRLSTLTHKIKAKSNDTPKPQGHPDSAATSMFLSKKHKHLGKELRHEEINVGVANTNTMNSVTTRQLQLAPDLPVQAHGFNEMDRSLISVPVLCDANCTVVFKKDIVQVIKDNEVIIEGPRDMETNLWNMPLENEEKENTDTTKRPFVIQLKHTANSAYQQKSASQLQAWHHATLGAPVVTTLIKAIDKNWLTTFPGLSSNGIRKHLPKSIQTTMGHMHKVRKNLRPTDKVTAIEIMEDVEEKEAEGPPPKKIEDRKHNVNVNAVAFEDLKGISSSDQTGAFPHTSARGNRYIMVMEDSDAGPILAVAIRSRDNKHLLEGFKEMHDTLKKAGINPILHRVDNEFSKELIEEIELRGLKYQIAPRGNHRTIPAERGMQTLKNHFISVLYGCDPTFPKNQWDRVLPVAVLTLNMLRPSRINPAKSAYNELWGNFDFNKTPLAPPGCLIVAHERPQERGTWDDHGVKGYFIGQAKHHYRNYRVYIPATRGVRTTDTIEFFPEHVQMPTTSSEDRLASATEDLIEILKKPHPPTPFLDQGTKTNDAIRKLQEIFTPRQRDGASTRVLRREATRVVRQPEEGQQQHFNRNRAAPRVELPIISENEIGTIIMKNYNNTIQRGEVTHYFEDEWFLVQ